MLLNHSFDSKPLFIIQMLVQTHFKQMFQTLANITARISTSLIPRVISLSAPFLRISRLHFTILNIGFVPSHHHLDPSHVDPVALHFVFPVDEGCE